MLKRLGSLVLSIAVLLTTVTAIAAPVSEGEDLILLEDTETAETAASTFDPETVMWTDNPIENVLAEEGIYATAKDINPNADKSADSGVQDPYSSNGTTYTGWEYAEYCWTNFYPIGNGRMAAMVAGGIDNEVIQINEDTCWDGSPYGTLVDQDGNTLSTLAETYKAETISVVDQTGGSREDGWRYYRGADPETDEPAEIGAENVLVGDEVFRETYPDFASKSIANQSLNIDNSANNTAVQERWSMEAMVEETFLGIPDGQRAYKSFVEVYLDFGQSHNDATNYVKSLDMETGLVTVEYDLGGSHYKRESFTSYPDQVVVTHIESDADLDFSAELHTYHSTDAGYYSYEKISDNEVKVKAAITNGNSNNKLGRINVIQFEARMLLDGDGAFSVSDDNTTVSVKGGKDATVYVVGATNYVDYLHLDNSKQGTDCEYYMNNVKSKTYDEIKARHLADFTELSGRTSLTLENTAGVDYSDTPTEKRVRKDINGESGFGTGADSKLATAHTNGVYSTYTEGDNQLATLEFNYGKYLIMSGSREGQEASGSGEIDIPESQPLNLTGKWNAAFSASWNGKYTININTEMNYWAAQPLNLADSEKPLIDALDELAQSGSITAANQYAIYNDRGDDSYEPGDPWVMHHNFDLWRGTQPIDNATAGLWPTGGAWLLDHAWQYYKYNKDEEYLAEVYPYMVGAAKFFTQFLVVDPETGYLITAASCSPEQGGVQPGPAMDTQLIRNLYDMVEQASEILGKTEEQAELLAKIDEQMPSTYLGDEAGKVAPNIIDSAGNIREWVRGDVTFDISERTTGQWTVTNPFTNETVNVYNHGASNTTNHRHCSHLWEMFPGTHLSAYSEDENEQKIFKAFQKSVSARSTGSGQGWGLAWRINLNARALDGDTSSSMLEQLFTTRTSPNLFDQHPNFQIDGNYGATSGVIEMLIQSHDGTIQLLPALPGTWSAGSFEGFNTREGATVDLTWSANKPSEAKFHATETGELSVRSKYVSEAVVYDENGNTVETTLNDDRNLITFSVEEGKTYTMSSFGSNVVEGDRIYKASDVTTFFASDGGSVPKLATDDTEVGYLYRREGVYVGYVVEDFDFDGLTKVVLNMAKVRDDDIYVVITVDSLNGTEIANQIISTGNNELDLKNLSSVSGIHDIYVAFIQDPYDSESSDKYLGNASDITASYSKTISGDTTDYDYTIESASYTEAGVVTADITYTGESDAPSAVVIAAAYDENGVLTSTAQTDISGSTSVELSLDIPENGSVSLYVWDGTDTIVPLSEKASAELNGSAEPTSAPTTAPTAVPTTAPTTAPTTEPTEAGVYIGSTKYETINEALAYVASNPPTSESERVYIDIMPGTYREQVVVETPYVTLRKMEGTSGDAVITWYYGLGSLYDSCNSSGYYDESVIGDGESYAPSDWGAALKVSKAATGFIAENLFIENSYNRYYTEEELTDITSVDPDTNNGMFHRVEWIQEQIANGVSDDEINAYLTTRTSITYAGETASPRERCAALHCSADKAQFINCEIISTQDTIGINTGRMYFKDCKLGGTTDYICGSAIAVFDNCELYVNAGSGGESATFTACSNASDEGYLFWNCHITGSEYSTPGSFGRPWNGNASVNYINTTIDYCGQSGYTSKLLVSDAGWSSMSANQPEDARFHEYGSVDSNGNTVSTSKRTEGTVLDEWSMLRYNPTTFLSGTDNWDPGSYLSSYDGVNEVINSTTIDTSDATTNTIALPSAPSGYEFSWESDSVFATVDGDALTLIRPAYGEDAITATVKLYVRDANDTSVGAEKSIEFSIEPTQDTTNVFTLSGTASISDAAEEDVEIKITVEKSGAVIKTETVTIPKGSTTASYTAENIPLGTYDVNATSLNTNYRVSTPTDGEASISASSIGEVQTLDITLGKLQEVTHTITSDPTSIGSGTTITNDNGTYTVSASTGTDGGGYWNIGEMFGSGVTTAETVTVAYTLTVPTVLTNTDGSKSASIDFNAGVPTAFSSSVNSSRILRALFGRWTQLNMITCAQAGTSGSANNDYQWLNCTGDQFKTESQVPVAYDITITADFKEDVVSSTVQTVMIGGESVDKSVYSYTFGSFPTSVDRENLSLALYSGSGGATEYSVSNISVTFSEYVE